MLAKSGVVTKQPRAQGTGKRRLVSVLFDVDLKFEVIEEDEVTETANPGPILIVAVFKMCLEFVKLTKGRGTLETRVHLKNNK